jgi:hypothetical protein
MESRDMFVVIAAPFTGAWIGTYCYFLTLQKHKGHKGFFSNVFSLCSLDSLGHCIIGG